MRRTIVTCDKCKKEIAEEQCLVFFGKDLCFECHERALNLIQQWLDSESYMPDQSVEEEPKEDKRKKCRIDWDRAVELKKQGWSHEAIAQEVGTTPGTISSSIYKHMEDWK